ncbi:10646_t:CDS:2, partial [Racocetra persica]
MSIISWDFHEITILKKEVHSLLGFGRSIATNICTSFDIKRIDVHITVSFNPRPWYQTFGEG